jgi:hypothetical protein
MGYENAEMGHVCTVCLVLAACHRAYLSQSELCNVGLCTVLQAATAPSLAALYPVYKSRATYIGLLVVRSRGDRDGGRLESAA